MRNYVQSVSDSEAVLLVDYGIGDFYDEWGNNIGVKAAHFIQELNWLNNGTRAITIKVNSFGGDVGEAKQMYDAIKSDGKCITHVVGMAASAASFLILAGKKVRMNEDALIMIHKGRVTTNESMTADELRQQADAVDKWNESIATIYEGKTGKPKAEWLTMMEKDCWIDASEALELNLVDEVITFDGKKKKKGETITASRSAKVDMSKADVMQVFNSYSIHTDNDNPMKEKLTAALNLTMAASETEILAAIKANQDEAAKLKAQLDELKAKNSDLEKKVEDQQTAQVTALVENAISSGKITANQKDNFTVMAKSNFQAASDLINSLVGRTTVMDKIQATGAGDERANWTYDDWQKKDATGLKAMMKDNTAKFTKLFNAHFGLKPVE